MNETAMNETAINDTAFADPRACRHSIRTGAHRGHTSGLAPGYAQGNLVILERSEAADFAAFCAANPKPCPLLGVSAPGASGIPALGSDLDLRSDLPAYRLWRDGEMVEERADIRDLWREDLVAFVIGCSFSFEQALIEAGIPLRHIAQGRNVAMYRTAIPTTPAGRFAGPLVVSMRPMKAADAIRAVEITARMPRVHGAPVHLGDPTLIGINDLAAPDYGDAVEIKPDEIPVFWACGVTPQAVVREARPAFCITHAPGAMLITDVKNNDLASN